MEKSIKDRNKRIIISFIFMLSILIFSLYKARIGIHSDEVHSLAVGDMISRGDSMFKDCWFYLQLSSVLSAPVFWIYNILFGNNDGIILFFRIISIVIQFIISLFFYKTFANRVNRFYVFAASVCLFLFVPDFLTFAYKPELIWFTMLEICFTYRYLKSGGRWNLVLLGCSVSLCVLCFPTAIMQAVVLFFYLIIRKIESREPVKVVLLVPFTCFCCAALFMLLALSKISLQEFLRFFPEMLKDDQLASNFITKLQGPFIKLIELGVLSIVPLVVCAKIRAFRKIVNNLHIPVISLLLILAFLGQCYIERLGITWHCITYPYSITLFFLPMLFYTSSASEKEENKDLFWCFCLMAWITCLCISIASNQGNITCIYSGVFSTCGMLVLVGNKRDECAGINIMKEKNIIAWSMIVMSLMMYVFPVWDQEAIYPEIYGMRSIFSERVYMTQGPLKGMRVGRVLADRVNALDSAIDEYTNDSDKVYIIENGFYTAFGYLYQRGEYATYSPRGHYFDRIVDYYEINQDKQATVILISKEYLKEIETIDFPKGKKIEGFLDNNDYIRAESDTYIIYRKV